jgi:hypothetical protein
MAISGGDCLMANTGHLIVEQPEVALANYNGSYIATANADALRELREAFAEFSISRYRGISRNYMIPLPTDEVEIKQWAASGIDVTTNAAARRRFGELLGTRSVDLANPPPDEDMCITLAEAQTIVALTDVPADWEIIRLARNELGPTLTTLGFDVGYWCGDHFSLIADTIVMPRWHPPATGDFAVLRNALKRLNQHVLFDTPEAADEYRRWYKSRPWAESESAEGQFCVIRVDRTNR